MYLLLTAIPIHWNMGTLGFFLMSASKRIKPDMQFSLCPESELLTVGYRHGSSFLCKYFLHQTSFMSTMHVLFHMCITFQTQSVAWYLPLHVHTS